MAEADQILHKIKQEESEMDLLLIKIEPEDENFGKKNQANVDPTNDDVCFEIKIEEENVSLVPYVEYSHSRPDSLLDVKIETKDLNADGRSILSHENEGLLDIANLIIENENAE